MLFLGDFFSAMADDDGISGLWKVAEQRFFDFTTVTLLLYESGIREAGDEDIFENRTLLFMVLLPFLIMNTEFLIRWNHIEGVGTVRSTGQLIPLVVAIFGLVNMVYKMSAKKEPGKVR